MRGKWSAVTRVLVCAVAVVLGCADEPRKSTSEGAQAYDPTRSLVVIDRPGSLAVVEEHASDEPQRLNLPTAVRGTVARRVDEKDSFVITPTRTGRLSASVQAQGGDLVFRVLTEAGTLLAASDRGGKGIAEGVPNYVLAPGSYRLEVGLFRKKRKRRRKPAKPSEGPAIRYRLEVQFLSTPERPGLEIEPDDTLTKANTLAFERPALGYIGWKSDTDLWRLPTPEPTLVSSEPAPRAGIDVDISGVPGVSLRVAVLDSKGKTLFERAADKGNAIAIRGFVPPTLRSEYYLRVRGRRSNPMASYRLGVVSRALRQDEDSEPNDKPGVARATGEAGGARDGIVSTAVRGSLSGVLTPGDTDVFVIRPDASGVVTITVATSDRADLTLAGLSPAGAVIAESDSGAESGSEQLVDLNVVAGQPLFVRVRAKRNRIIARYTFTWSIADAATPPGAGPSSAAGDPGIRGDASR